MEKNLRLLLIVSFLFVSFICKGTKPKQTNSSRYELEVYNFIGSTNDMLYWEGETFYLSHSPISEFADFQYIYPQFTVCRINEQHYMFNDKNYRLTWIISDNSLYLSAVRPVTKCDCDTNLSDYDPLPLPLYYYNYTQKLQSKMSLYYLYSMPTPLYQTLEKFTGRRFLYNHRFPVGILKAPLTPLGVMPATWFTGMLDLKVVGDAKKTTPWMNRITYQRLFFWKGKLVAVQKMDPMPSILVEALPDKNIRVTFGD